MLDPREKHPYLVHTAQALDQAIRESGTKAEWLAKVIGVSDSALSFYRSGDRPIPAFLVPLVDEALGGHSVQRALASMAGCELVPSIPVRRTVVDSLAPLIARNSGALLGALIEAQSDNVVTQEEREAVFPIISRLIHQLQAEAEWWDPRAIQLRKPT